MTPKISNIRNVLFSATKSSLFGYPLELELYRGLSVKEWHDLYDMAKSQGVAAVVWDAVAQLPIEYHPPRQLKMKWIAITSNIETNYDIQLSNSTRLAEEFHKVGIDTFVLKGIALSKYYPIPQHRECGDLDCFLGSNYELGNIIAEKLGAKVNRDYYRHSNFKYRQLTVENHQFCLPIRGNREMKETELHLWQLLCRSSNNYIDNTQLIAPPADFNAIFLTYHSMTHFLTEGIKLRNICDWALLLKAEQNNIDWKEFYQICNKLNYTRIANILTYISTQYLGLTLENNDISTESKEHELVLNDLFEQNNIFNKGYSVWKSRFMTIKNRFRANWKYKKIYGRSMILSIVKQIIAFIMERKPHLITSADTNTNG